VQARGVCFSCPGWSRLPSRPQARIGSKISQVQVDISNCIDSMPQLMDALHPVGDSGMYGDLPFCDSTDMLQSRHEGGLEDGKHIIMFID
jgi:hypothetical protein